MTSVPQVAQQISQEQNQQQNGQNLSSLHNSLPVPHSGSPAFLQQVQRAGYDFGPNSSSCKKKKVSGGSFKTASTVRRNEEDSMKLTEHVKNRNKRLIKKENLQKEVVLPELLTFTVEKYVPDLADVADAAEVLLPRSSAQIMPVLETVKDWTGVVGKAV